MVHLTGSLLSMSPNSVVPGHWLAATSSTLAGLGWAGFSFKSAHVPEVLELPYNTGSFVVVAPCEDRQHNIRK